MFSSRNRTERTLINRFSTANLRGDLFGGATTAIISLPLALAFGVASGAGPEAGLYGALLVGLFASLFGGSSTLISEPTGPMTVIMTAVLTTMVAANPEGGVAMAFTVVMMAGAFQILFGALKLGKYITLMPYSVISGFMSGIGIILILLQLPPLLGQPTQPGGAMGTISALPELIAGINPTAALLGLATLLLLLFTPKRLSNHLPPQLIALILGTGVAFLWLGNSGLTTVGEISIGLPAIVLPTFTPALLTTMVVDALLLAILGCIDTLLSAVIADSLTRKDHDSNKELIGQGLGNMFSGFCGGLPGAGATMGTVVNIQSGGRTPLAGALRVLILAVIIFGAAELTEHIPLAVLAAIAIKVGIDILDWSFLKRAHRINLPTTIIMYGVMLMTVFIDLMVAVGVGVFVANVLTIEKLSQVQSRKVRAVRAISDADDEVPLDDEERTLLEGAAGRILLFYLTGPMIFGVTKAISRQHAEVKDYDVMVLDLSSVSMLDTTVALALENAIVESTESGCTVYLVSEDEDLIDQLASLGLFDVIGEDAVVPRRIDALNLATAQLEQPANQRVFNLPVRAKAASA